MKRNTISFERLKKYMDQKYSFTITQPTFRLKNVSEMGEFANFRTRISVNSSNFGNTFTQFSKIFKFAKIQRKKCCENWREIANQQSNLGVRRKVANLLVKNCEFACIWRFHSKCDMNNCEFARKILRIIAKSQNFAANLRFLVLCRRGFVAKFL